MLSAIRFLARATRCALIVVCGATSSFAGAEQWVPQWPLRLIVPFPPGGTADLLARLLATPLGNALGQQIVADNRGGAGGIISMDAVAHTQPDGYAFGIPSLSAHASYASLIEKLPYDSTKDFLPLTFVAQVPAALVVHASNPATSVLLFVNGGRLRAIAIADQQRSMLLPNVVTMAEAGYANFDFLEPWVLAAPAGTPADAVRRLRAEAVKVLQQPDIVERYTAQGLTLAPSTPQGLREIMAGEIKKYRDIIQRAGIKVN